MKLYCILYFSFTFILNLELIEGRLMPFIDYCLQASSLKLN